MAAKKTNKSKVKKTSVEKKTSKQAEPEVAVATKASAKTVVIDRRSGDRDRRAGEDRRQKSVPVEVERRVLQRREKVSRRRQIDPTTCERDYSDDEIEFMSAMDNYKRTSGRMFPTCSEILEVIRKLGYEKRSVMAPAAPIVASPDLTYSLESLPENVVL